jgi:hypothetical protein
VSPVTSKGTFAPGVELLTAKDADQYMPIRCSDWDRIKRQVGRLKERESYLPGVAWTAIGIGASAGLALIPWNAAFAQFPASLQEHYSYVSPMMVITAIACGIIAAFCFFVGFRLNKSTSANVDDVIADMAEISKRYLEESNSVKNPKV